MNSFIKTLVSFIIILNVSAEVVVLDVSDKGTGKSINKFSLSIYEKGKLIKTEDVLSNVHQFDANKGSYLIISSENYLEERVSYNGKDKISVTLGKDSAPLKLKGTIIDRDSFEPAKNIDIKLINKMTGEEISSQTSNKGDFYFEARSGYDYDIEMRSKNYLKKYASIESCKTNLDQETNICFSGFNSAAQNKDKSIQVQALVDKIEIGKTFKVDNIYYDLNSAKLRLDSYDQLNKLVAILKDNPKIVLELGSHADSRGADEYNLELSQKRAQSAVDYIIDQGITLDKITPRGYGESKLLNQCINDVFCVENDHQINRRTEFKIIDIKN